MRFSGALRRNERILGFLLTGCMCLAQTEPRPPKRMTTPSPRGRTFTLLYTSEGGPELGAGLHERQTLLTIRSEDGSVFLEQHRSESDAAGAPIGTFRMVSEADPLEKLLEYADRERLENLAPPSGGGPGATVMEIRLEEGNRKIAKTLTSRDIPQIGQLEYFLYQLNQVMTAVRRTPYQAVRVTLAPDTASRRFVVGIENIGTANVCLFDPRTIGHTTPERRTVVRFAELPEERPGVTSPPLRWTELPVQAAVSATPSMVTLKAGERLTVPSASWTARSGVRYLVQGIWSDYTAPGQAAGCYFVRGAAFSENLKIVG